jgi:hypothetical protein
MSLTTARPSLFSSSQQEVRGAYPGVAIVIVISSVLADVANLYLFRQLVVWESI